MRKFMEMIAGFQTSSHNEILKQLITQKTRCGFFFSGDDPVQAADLVHQLRGAGVDLRCVYVLHPELMLGQLEDIPFYSLKEVAGNPLQLGQVIMRVDLFAMKFYEYFEQRGISTFMLNDTQAMDARSRLIYEHMPQIYDIYSSLMDEESRCTYRHVLMAWMSNRLSDYRFAPEGQYLLQGFMPGAGDIAIDGGAFDGGTARDFASLGAKVYAFEMDQDNYQQCRPAAEQYGFTVENLGLGDSEREDHYAAAGTSSSLNGNGGKLARVIDLDTYVQKNALPRIDYIKLDVEGAELQTLRGAVRSIGKWKPKMAVSTYHKDVDLWTLAGEIRSIRPDYEFAFRHYRIDARDYWLGEGEKRLLQEHGLDCMIPTPCETVLYCR